MASLFRSLKKKVKADPDVMKAVPEDVRHAYRLLLGREPDPEGHSSYLKYIAEHPMRPTDVAAIFLGSAEFKSRQAEQALREEVLFQGLKIFPWKGDSLVGELIKSTGMYESYMLPIFIESLPVGGTVLDVGANIGIYALAAARKVGECGRVFAIEPVARNVESLCAGIIANGLSNVSVLPVAASSAVGVVPLLRYSNSSNGIVDMSRPDLAEAFVPAQRLDLLLACLDRLDVVKIDIEGHEPIAWPSIEVLVARHRPLVFTEFNPKAIRNHSRTPPEHFAASLLATGGRLEALHVDGRRISCATVDEVMEQWRDANRRANSDGDCHLDLLLDARPNSSR